jgi:hypothetical protein
LIDVEGTMRAANRVFAQIQAYLNGAFLGLFTLLYAAGGRFGTAFRISLGCCILFFFSGLAARNGELRPLVFSWLIVLGVFCWASSYADWSFMHGGLVLFAVFLYLIAGIVGSITIYATAYPRNASRV